MYFCTKYKPMKRLHIITPVKDSIDSTLKTIHAVLDSELNVPYTYTVYNDFSTPENTALLENKAENLGFQLVNLSDLTSHPSPNYLLVLQRERQLCLEDDAALLIVESDVTVRPDTLQRLWDGALGREECGLAAAVTVDEEGKINYPYLFARRQQNRVLDTRRHCSFCCTLLTNELLKRVDFGILDSEKNWFDVTISHLSLDAGFHNYLFTTLPVLHQPHASRPWKRLKYTNPLKYYWLKFTKGFDKI